MPRLGSRLAHDSFHVVGDSESKGLTIKRMLHGATNLNMNQQQCTQSPGNL